MPQIGEVVHPNDLVHGDELDPSQVVDHEGSALSRFMSGGLSTSPLNPMNWVRAASHPIDTISSIVGDPISELMQAGKHAGEVITGSQGDRLTPAVQTIEHLAGAIPFVGKALTHAGEQIGDGDIAGGTGELAGIASGALLPKITGRVPGAVTRVGQGMEAVGEAFKGHSKWSGAAAMSHGNIAAGAGIMAAPYALEYGGKGLQAAGSALEGLKGRVSGAPIVDRYMPNKGAGPQTEFAEPASVEPTQYEVEQYGPAAQGPGPQTEFAAPATVEPTQYVVDPHMPNTSGYNAPVEGLRRAGRPAERVISQAEQENIHNGSHYGNGHVMPDPKPTELLDVAVEGPPVQHGHSYVDESGRLVRFPELPSDFEAGADVTTGRTAMLDGLKAEAAAPGEVSPEIRAAQDAINTGKANAPELIRDDKAWEDAEYSTNSRIREGARRNPESLYNDWRDAEQNHRSSANDFARDTDQQRKIDQDYYVKAMGDEQVAKAVSEDARLAEALGRPAKYSKMSIEEARKALLKENKRMTKLSESRRVE